MAWEEKSTTGRETTYDRQRRLLAETELLIQLLKQTESTPQWAGVKSQVILSTLRLRVKRVQEFLDGSFDQYTEHRHAYQHLFRTRYRSLLDWVANDVQRTFYDRQDVCHQVIVIITQLMLVAEELMIKAGGIETRYQGQPIQKFQADLLESMERYQATRVPGARMVNAVPEKLIIPFTVMSPEEFKSFATVVLDLDDPGYDDLNRAIATEFGGDVATVLADLLSTYIEDEEEVLTSAVGPNKVQELWQNLSYFARVSFTTTIAWAKSLISYSEKRKHDDDQRLERLSSPDEVRVQPSHSTKRRRGHL